VAGPIKDFFQKLGTWGTFTLNVTLVIVVFIIGIFIGVFVQNKTLFNKEMLVRAKANYESILITRRWNAKFHGVYVEKTEGVVSNPYLEDADVTTSDGRVFTKKNPALMTRELSDSAANNKYFSYHMSSLKPINPENMPDSFEKKALLSFENNQKDFFEKEKQDVLTMFRYMAPLYVEESCLKCHYKQDYEVGDVIGGISVSFDVTDIENALNLNRYILLFLGISVTLLLLGLVYFFIFRLMRRLTRAQEKIQLMLTTDELTGLHNRRHFFERLEEELPRAKRYGHDTSCIMLDIDHFKKVNDTYGHLTGDMVLVTLARLLKTGFRETDVVARYGGEEILILLPETDVEHARVVAEKIRAMVEEQEMTDDEGRTIQITASLGVAGLSPERLESVVDPDSLIKCADEALYRAKEGGRNRVEV
jgi:diguanylate cyclase (GGDEF)-like protein